MISSQKSFKPDNRLPAIFSLLLAFIFSFASISALAQKTDVIYMLNGDRLTGEIKELLLGEVYFETSFYGNIKVKWKDIKQIDSDKHIRFETTDGTSHFGQIDSTTSDREITVITTTGDAALPHQQIVHLEQINRDQGFWDRLDKNLRIGFSYTQASDILRWNVAAGLELRETAFNANISYESFVTNNSNGEDSSRANLGGGYTHYLDNRYLWALSADIQSNDELGVDRRFLVAGGFGRYIWQTQATEFSAAVGLAANWEASVGDIQASSENNANLEGVLSFDWTYFKLSSPQSRYSARLDLYPGITDTGRNRANFTFNFKQEFVEDLYWNMEFYGSYDSRPPAGAKSTSDYGVFTSLQYEW